MKTTKIVPYLVFFVVFTFASFGLPYTVDGTTITQFYENFTNNTLATNSVLWFGIAGQTNDITMVDNYFTTEGDGDQLIHTGSVIAPDLNDFDLQRDDIILRADYKMDSTEGGTIQGIIRANHMSNTTRMTGDINYFFGNNSGIWDMKIDETFVGWRSCSDTSLTYHENEWVTFIINISGSSSAYQIFDVDTGSYSHNWLSCSSVSASHRNRNYTAFGGQYGTYGIDNLEMCADTLFNYTTGHCNLYHDLVEGSGSSPPPANNGWYVTSQLSNTTTGVNEMELTFTGSESLSSSYLHVFSDGCGTLLQNISNTSTTTTPIFYVDSLTENTTYCFQGWGTNGYNYNSTSQADFTTENAPPSTNNGIEVTGITNTTTNPTNIVIQLTTSEGAKATLRRFSDASCSSYASQEWHNTSFLSSFEFYPSGLSESTTYYFKGNVSNGYNTNTSSCLSVTTEETPTTITNYSGKTYVSSDYDWFSYLENTTIKDEVENNNGNSLTGCSEIDGFENQAINCSSGISHFTINRTERVNFTNAFAIASWTKWGSSATRLMIESTNPSLSMDWGIDLDASGHIQIVDSGSNGYQTTSSGFNDGDWHFIVVQSKGNYVGIIVDGQNQTLTEVGTFSPFTHTTGKYYAKSYANNGWLGVDNMALFNRTLDMTTILIANNTGKYAGRGTTFLVNYAINNTPVSDFTITMTNETARYTQTTTTGIVWFNVSSGTYEYEVEGNNIGNITGNVTGGTINTLLASTANSFTITFKDEITNEIISDRTVYTDLIGEDYSNNYTTSNAELFIESISPAYYTIRYWAENYSTSYYAMTLGSGESIMLTLYLLNTSKGTPVTYYVIDQNANRISGAIIKVQRYDIASNSYKTVDILTTNIEGVVETSIQLNTEFYRYTVEYEGETKLVTYPSIEYATERTLQINLIGTPLQNFFSLLNVEYSIEFNNATNNFRLEYNDLSNTATQGCLEVVKASEPDSIIASNCNSGASGTILSALGTPENNTLYLANAYIEFSGNLQLLGVGEYSTYTAINETGIGQSSIGWWAVLFLIFILGFIARWSKTLMFVLAPLPLVLMSALGMIEINVPTAVAVEVTGIILALIFRDGS